MIISIPENHFYDAISSLLQCIFCQLLNLYRSYRIVKQIINYGCKYFFAATSPLNRAVSVYKKTMAESSTYDACMHALVLIIYQYRRQLRINQPSSSVYYYIYLHINYPSSTPHSANYVKQSAFGNTILV